MAVASGAPSLHPKSRDNVIVQGNVKTEGFDAVWNGAHKIIEINARSQPAERDADGTRAVGNAAYEMSTGRVTLTCATQMPHLTRTAIADILGFPESDLRVVAPDVGGGFGQKMSLPPEYVLLVWLARKHRSSFA